MVNDDLPAEEDLDIDDSNEGLLKEKAKSLEKAEE